MFPTTSSGSDPVGNAFAPVYSMIGGRGGTGGTQVTGGGSGAFGLQPQGMQGNDLTQMQRSLTNLLGQTGAQLGPLGQNVLGAGLAGAEQGFGAMGTGLETLNQPLAYWQAIMGGDPRATSAALGPTATNLSTIAGGALDKLRGVPSGGYGALAANLIPQAQAAQLGNALLGLQPQAAQNIASIGAEQAQIGSAMGQLGTGVGGLGTTLTGQGLQGLDAATKDVLQKMGINVQEGGPLKQITGLLGALGQLAGGVGGAMIGAKMPST